MHTLQNYTHGIVVVVFGVFLFLGTQYAHAQEFVPFTISGKVFNDLNADGVRTDGTSDPNLAGWTIRLDVVDSSEVPVCTTGVIVDEYCEVIANSFGNYTFPGILAGTYEVSEIAQEGWIQTAPHEGSGLSATSEGTYIVLGQSGTNRANRNFGNTQLGSITVTVETSPLDSPQAFSFLGSWSGTEFSLTHGQSVQQYVLPGTVSITSTNLPVNWNETVLCSDGSLVGAIEVSAGETVVCTFTYEYVGVVDDGGGGGDDEDGGGEDDDEDEADMGPYATRGVGFWKNHTALVQHIFDDEIGMITLGGDEHTKSIDTYEKVLGTWFASVAKVSTAQGKNGQRNIVDQVRLQLARHWLVTALNCSAFGCDAETEELLTEASGAYTWGDVPTMRVYVENLETYNESRVLIPTEYDTDSATPQSAQQNAFVAFWDTL